MNHHEDEIKQCMSNAEHQVGPQATLIIAVAAVGRSGVPCGFVRQGDNWIWDAGGRVRGEAGRNTVGVFPTCVVLPGLCSVPC